LLITSAKPAEGKSTTAVNLAIVMAQAGLRVVIVDADLRRPSLHLFFGLDNSDGLSTALLKAHPNPGPYLRSTELDNLQVLCSGPLPPNPSELLGHVRMVRVLQALKEQADVIVLDSPPVLPVTDAAVLAHHVDGVLLVAQYAATPSDALVKARDELIRVGGRILGVTINRISAARGSAPYYYAGEYRAHGDRGSGFLGRLTSAFGRRPRNPKTGAPPVGRPASG
jgi:capsular exopolysaccharide synthesis family protein